MAVPPAYSRHLDEWIGSIPSAWWVYLKLRVREHLSPGASGGAVRRVIREAISEGDRQRREQLARLRAQELTASQADRVSPLLGASWNTLVPEMLLPENLLSAKGDDMARKHCR
jgi:hypothetical protein